MEIKTEWCEAVSWMPEKSELVLEISNYAAFPLQQSLGPIKAEEWGDFLSLYRWFFFHNLKLAMPWGEVWAGFPWCQHFKRGNWGPERSPNIIKVTQLTVESRDSIKVFRLSTLFLSRTPCCLSWGQVRSLINLRKSDDLRILQQPKSISFAKKKYLTFPSWILYKIAAWFN